MACKHKKRLWENGWCNVACRYCTFTQESTCEHNKQTNADRIRAMSDEELAEFLWFFDKKETARECVVLDGGIAIMTRRQLVNWLRQPVKDGDNDG